MYWIVVFLTCFLNPDNSFIYIFLIGSLCFAVDAVMLDGAEIVTFVSIIISYFIGTFTLNTIDSDSKLNTIFISAICLTAFGSYVRYKEAKKSEAQIQHLKISLISK